MTPDLRSSIQALLEEQSPHVMFPLLAVDFSRGVSVECVWVTVGGCAPKQTNLAGLIELKRAREEKILKEQDNPFITGEWPTAWHELLWELCCLRVANPGLPIEFLVGGANGSAKTFFAAAVIMWAMVRAPAPRPGQKGRLFWSLAEDEPNSKTVAQSALYFWLPISYKTASGSVKKMARTKLNFNDSGGFTDNRFGLDNASQMECRFWSKNISTLEGPRPYCVWVDEEAPLAWVVGLRKRLLSYAEGTKEHIPQWVKLLEQRKEADAAGDFLRFPKELLWQLLRGVQLITYTAKSGYTPTVAAFLEGGKVMREIDAVLLAKTDPKTGEACGFEKAPKLIHCQDPQRRMMFIHAWDNPWMGNWEGMKKSAIGMPRSEILWWCYGVAEKIGDSPFPNFNVQAHVRPPSFMPQIGSWYHIVDPVASGGRAWFQIWAIVSGETRGHIQPGDIFVAWEWPKEDWHVRDEGFMGRWAEPGGKAGQGVRGPAQRSLGWGYRRQKEEIAAVEHKLWAMQYQDGEPDAAREARVRDLRRNRAARSAAASIALEYVNLIREPRITVGNRIMDSRAANTEKENESEAKTLIEWMEEDSPGTWDGLDFIPAGRDSGAATGQTRVHPGEQMINNLLYFDKELAVLDEKTGRLVVPPALGRGPRLYISEGCTNLIAALRHYPGIFTGADSAFKDPIDCLRYLVIADPQYTGNVQRFSSSRTGGGVKKMSEIGDW